MRHNPATYYWGFRDPLGQVTLSLPTAKILVPFFEAVVLVTVGSRILDQMEQWFDPVR